MSFSLRGTFKSEIEVLIEGVAPQKTISLEEFCLVYVDLVLFFEVDPILLVQLIFQAFFRS